MKKIAIFVEGETECDFMKRLLVEIVGKNNIKIIGHKMVGGNKNSRISRTANLQFESLIDGANFEATIFISSQSENVDSDIIEQKDTLLRLGFSKIIGLKDLRGNQNGRKLTPEDFPKIELGSRLTERRSRPIPTQIITAVMEIETWFLAETNHYICIDDRLTEELILSKTDDLGFNPFTENLTLRLTPKEDLQNLYGLVKKTYSKKETVRNKTINCLDYSNLRNNVGVKIDQIKQLFESIDEFIK
jgi:hypothetical protein